MRSQISFLSSAFKTKQRFPCAQNDWVQHFACSVRTAREKCLAYQLLGKWILQGKQKPEPSSFCIFPSFLFLQASTLLVHSNLQGGIGLTFFLQQTLTLVIERLILGRERYLRWNGALSLCSEGRAKRAMKQHNTLKVGCLSRFNTAFFLLALPLHSGTGSPLLSSWTPEIQRP